jgi:hypothetical protein
MDSFKFKERARLSNSVASKISPSKKKNIRSEKGLSTCRINTAAFSHDNLRNDSSLFDQSQFFQPTHPPQDIRAIASNVGTRSGSYAFRHRSVTNASENQRDASANTPVQRKNNAKQLPVTSMKM